MPDSQRRKKRQRFKFKGYDENRKETSGSIESTSVNSAVSKLKKMGIKAVIINGKDPFEVSTDSNQIKVQEEKWIKSRKLFKKILLKTEAIEYAGISLGLLIFALMMFELFDSMALNKYKIVLAELFLVFLYLCGAFFAIAGIVKGLKGLKMFSFLLSLFCLYFSLRFLYLSF